MHESRIAALEARLEIITALEKAKKPTKRIDPGALAADRARTVAELTALRGIQTRNRAWHAQAPALAVAESAAKERRRSIRERAQLTPGSRIPTEGA